MKLPLLTVDNFSGILIIPTKSSVGTRDRRIDLIRIASPFPLWISCQKKLSIKKFNIEGHREIFLKIFLIIWFFFQTLEENVQKLNLSKNEWSCKIQLSLLLYLFLFLYQWFHKIINSQQCQKLHTGKIPKPTGYGDETKTYEMFMLPRELMVTSFELAFLPKKMDADLCDVSMHFPIFSML